MTAAQAEGLLDAQTLLQMLYALPVGVLCVEGDGAIRMMTPLAAARLQALGALRHGSNGWDVLRALDVALAERVMACFLTPGNVAFRVRARGDGDSRSHSGIVLSVTVVNPGQAMIVLEAEEPASARRD